MQDAEREHPVCGDAYAKVFMNEDALKIYEPFRSEVKPNASNVARHRIIDDFLRQFLSEDQGLCVVIIGAGFDSRAYRLKGGTWIELDEPQVIDYKNGRLPLSECKNELHRIPIDFSADSLEEKLSAFLRRASVVVVVEGVFMYLSHDVINHLLHTLRRIFPQHKLLCDLMSQKFFEKYSRTLHEKIKDLGTSFKYTVDRPADIFIDNGYDLKGSVSIVEKAAEWGTIIIPRLVMKTFLRTLTKGYSVCVFEAH